ncbi:hypothetical protein [Streptomyces sp. DvalAA-19]|uniref:hypothetical protein n=1 Tax=Streptomyces sp. DvalAA-19 TaxID=1839761 RepID=UPI00081B9AF1|nr:hypothetical protein [Streptomyces sp. DvalAA-19]SCD99828.1 Uncharacterized protein, contains a NRPS condensation (elongation) domain [Streptomyces sp. DvalAA-19]
MTSTTTAATPTTPAARPYTRRISPIERGYLNAAATGTPQLIQMIIEGEGTLDPDALRQAARAATLASPGLAVRRRGALWRADGPVPDVVELPADATPDTHPFFHRDLSVVTGPVGELGLIQAGSTTHLAIRASHIVTDGKGLRQWIADLFRALRGEEPVGCPDTVDDGHFRTMAGPVPPAPAATRLTGLPAVVGRGPAGERPLWLRRRVAAVPSGVTARAAAALSRHLATDTGRLIVPVDLRRHDPTVRSTANLTSQLVLGLHRDDSWKRIHSTLVRALVSKAEVAALDRDFLRDNPFANNLSEARELDGSRFPCTAIISDHGEVDPRTYSTPAFRATSFATLPMLVPYAEMFLSACRIGATTELTLSCRNRPGAREKAEELLTDMAKALEQ